MRSSKDNHERHKTVTTQELLTVHDQLDKDVAEASSAWNRLCKGHTDAMGRVDDYFRLTIEYRVKRDEYYRAFKKLREFNQSVSKNTEYQKIRYAELMVQRFANVK